MGHLMGLFQLLFMPLLALGALLPFAAVASVIVFAQRRQAGLIVQSLFVCALVALIGLGMVAYIGAGAGLRHSSGTSTLFNVFPLLLLAGVVVGSVWLALLWKRSQRLRRLSGRR